MFLVDKLSKKFTVASAKATFGILGLLASLLICASLLTPAWRHADADVRLYTSSSSGTILSGLKLSTGLFGFSCNYAIEQSAGNKYPIEGTDLCRGWAEVQPLYEKIASALVSAGLACSLVGFFWNLLTRKSATVLVKILPLLALLPTLLLASALILFFINSCRDTRITTITLGQSTLNNTGCSIGYSYTLALLAFLFSLASVLVGAVISAKVATPRRQQRKQSSSKSKANVLIKKRAK